MELHCGDVIAVDLIIQIPEGPDCRSAATAATAALRIQMYRSNEIGKSEAFAQMDHTHYFWRSQGRLAKYRALVEVSFHRRRALDC